MIRGNCGVLREAPVQLRLDRRLTNHWQAPQLRRGVRLRSPIAVAYCSINEIAEFGNCLVLTSVKERGKLRPIHAAVPVCGLKRLAAT
jgi:hypothetical protein